MCYTRICMRNVKIKYHLTRTGSDAPTRTKSDDKHVDRTIPKKALNPNTEV